MSDLILHHYAMSPFSEKVRKMLGYGQLNWQSVVIREMPPRPHLDVLAGGYRKVPVAQIGADIFCDTRTIATEIAERSHVPELALEHCSAEVQDYVARVDLDMFFACLLSSGTFKLGRNVWRAMSAADIYRFARDRVSMGRKASIPKITIKEAKALMQSHLVELEARLIQDYVFGDVPNHGDFSTYHSLWFSRDLAESKLFKAYPKVEAWMDRVKAFGDGGRSEISIEQALAAAKAATPREIAQDQLDDPHIGKTVRIGPVDYAKDHTEGTLVGSTPSQWILARQHDAVGTVHVHFPKLGYALETA
jgi:glutathione S-transferase